VKRRLAVIAATVTALGIGSSFVASADAAAPQVARDTSGCVVLLPDAARPLTICLFPR